MATLNELLAQQAEINRAIEAAKAESAKAENEKRNQIRSDLHDLHTKHGFDSLGALLVWLDPPKAAPKAGSATRRDPDQMFPVGSTTVAKAGGMEYTAKRIADKVIKIEGIDGSFESWAKATDAVIQHANPGTGRRESACGFWKLAE